MPAEQPSLFDLPPRNPNRAFHPASPLASVIDSWLAHLKAIDTSPHTLTAFRSDLNVLLEYLDPETPLDSVATASLNQFLEWMRHERGKPCSDKTYGRRVTTLKAFFRWATPLAELRLDPAEAIVQLNVRSPLPVVLNEAEIEKCLAAGERLRQAEKPDLRPLALFRLLLDTGMKKVEVANLKIEHLHLAKTSDLHLYVRYPQKKDWPKERRLNLSPEWVEAYRAYLEVHPLKDEAVFPWSIRKLELALGEVGAGLDKSVSFDTMRWTCAVRDYVAGMEAEALRRKLGLSPIQWRETGERIRKLAEDMN